MRNRCESHGNWLGSCGRHKTATIRPPVCNHQYSTTIILGQKIIGGEGLLVGIACPGVGTNGTGLGLHVTGLGLHVTGLESA